MSPEKPTEGFTLRDYLAYLFPGSLIVAELVFIFRGSLKDVFGAGLAPDWVWVWVPSGSYLLGFISHAIGWYIFRYISKDSIRLADPAVVVLKKNPGLLPEQLRLKIVKRLRGFWGAELCSWIDEEGKADRQSALTLFFLCYRQVQHSGSPMNAYPDRCVTLMNLALSFLLPAVGLSFLAFRFPSRIAQICVVLVALAACVILYEQARSFRRGMVVNVFRAWYVIDQLQGNDEVETNRTLVKLTEPDAGVLRRDIAEASEESP